MEPSPGLKNTTIMDSGAINTNVNNDEGLFDTLVILEFSLKVPPPAIQWILDKIKLQKFKGGSELLVCPIVDENYEVCCYSSSCIDATACAFIINFFFCFALRSCLF